MERGEVELRVDERVEQPHAHTWRRAITDAPPQAHATL